MIQRAAITGQAVAVGAAILFGNFHDWVGVIACTAVALACGAHARIENFDSTGRPQA